MSAVLKHFLLCLLSVSAGFFTAPFVWFIGHLAGLFPDVETQGTFPDTFMNDFFGGIMWAWLVASLVGITLYLALRTRKGAKLFLLLPFLMPTLYGFLYVMRI